MLDHVSTVRDSFAGRARRLPGLATLTAAAALGTFASPAAGATCESLAKLSIPDVTIASAQTVAAGAFVPPPGRGGAAPNTAQFKDAPAFCRVQGSVKRAGATDAKIEYWLPMTGWNGDFQTMSVLSKLMHSGAREPSGRNRKSARNSEPAGCGFENVSRILFPSRLKNS